MLTGDRKLTAMKQLDDSVRGAGQEPGASLHQKTDVDGRKGVDIFQWGHRVEYRPLVKPDTSVALRRQGQLDQDAVDRRIVVESADDLEEFLLAGRRRQTKGPTLNSDLLAGPTFVANIHLAGGVFSDEDRGQARLRAALLDELMNVPANLLANIGGDAFSVQDSRCHRVLPLTWLPRTQIDRHSEIRLRPL